MPDPGVREIVAFGAALVAGVMNSMAGGGTLVAFPALIWLGLPAINANATSTVATLPGTLGAIWGFRRELRRLPTRAFAFMIPCLIGGIVGAVLLRLTPSAIFDRLVPLLILFATLLFMAQGLIQRRFGLASGYHHLSGAWFAGAMVFLFLVAVYGGYFGAGIGILLMGGLSILGFSDILQLAGFKNLLAVTTNGIASVYFIWSGMVFWPETLVMAFGAILGGLGGAALARRMGPLAVRWIVIAIGFGMTVSLLIRR